MNGKKFIPGLGAVLLCASLIAYGADSPGPTASVFVTKTISPQTAAATSETTANTGLKTGANRHLAHDAALMAGSTKKDVDGITLGQQRGVPANDNCEDAELVTGPYPVTVCGTTLGATIDCPGVLDRKAVWYKVTLPYAVNTLVADYCPSDVYLASYDVGSVYFNDCTCGVSVYGRYEWHDCGDGQSNPLMRWDDLPGPTTVLIPVYVNPPHDFCIEFNVTEVVQPVNDACENAEPVTGPYPTTVCGTNVGATIDCPGSLYWKAVWYEVELPYALNNLVTQYCPSETNFSSYYIAPAYLNNCGDCNAPVEGSYEWHDCGDGKWNALIWWNEIPGPTTIMLPFYSSPVSDFCFEINVTEAVPPANDTCENAELVTGPYPVTVCGTNTGATIDCPGALGWRGVWYEVQLPYAVNTVVTDYCPGEIDMRSDSIGIVYVDDCSCEVPVVGDYYWHDCGNTKYNPLVSWRNVPGPGSMLIPVNVDPAHDFCIEVNVTNGACDLDCPPESVAEGETCGGDTNGGCNMSVPAFEPLTCGETVCGTAWADGGMRDTDWYEITIAEPTTLTFTVQAEFVTGVSIGLMEPLTPGVVGCDQLTGLINPSASGGECEAISVVYDALPGTYWWFVGPDGGSDMPCGGRNEYTATMTGEPWEVRGACCDDATHNCTDNVLLQNCPDPMRFGGKDSTCADLSPPCGGCPESMFEIEIRTDRYPNETMWRITDHSDPTIVICSGGPYDKEYTTYFEYCCIGADDCVDFTIYDRAGDGQSWWDGGYAVRLDGVELCSTLENSWAGFESSCSSLGNSCELGRCCYYPWPNCADATRFDCVSLYDGVWTEGMNCADDPCQNPDAPNFEVVAPYTSPQRSTCGSLDRCHPENQYSDTPEHVYRVTIPHDGVWSFNTCLDTTIPTWLAVGTSLCSEDIGWAAWSCGPGAEVVAYLTAGDYFADVEGNSEC
ncbi:MAG: hypothetical protein JXB13_14875, partial [Phycisphaerae bacterium]|nr:hypothetical protein [Phycisphaerae bacterium]